MVGAARQEPVEHERIETMRRSKRIGDSLYRVLVEIETGRTEGEIEIGDHNLALEPRGDGKGCVVANRA